MKKSIVLVIMTTLLSLSRATAQDTQVVKHIESLGDEIATSLKDKAGWRLAVMNFLIYNKELSEKGVDEAAVAILETGLTEKGILLVERRRLIQVVDEIGLGETGLLDPSSVAQAGKMLGANGMILGSITEMGNAIVINVKLVEVESAEIIFTSFATVDRAEMIQEAEKYVVFVGGDKSLILAGLGSALIPGVGQVYARKPLKGVIFFTLVAAGVAGFFGEGNEADRYKEEYEIALEKYRQSYNLEDIERYEQERINANQSYLDADMRQDGIVTLTSIVYVLGTLDAVWSAHRFNKEMQEKYAINVVPREDGVFVSVRINF